MTDRDRLLLAVLANPKDDFPRLVMADWLEEHDQPELAELIRVQCELTRWRAEAAARFKAMPKGRKQWETAEAEEFLALVHSPVMRRLAARERVLKEVLQK